MANPEIEAIKAGLEGRVFKYLPITKGAEPFEVTVKEGKLLKSETGEPAPMVGVRWSYIRDCADGKVNTSPVQEESSAPRTPRAPRGPSGAAVPRSHAFKDKVYEIKADPYPDQDPNHGNKELFWANNNFKNLIRFFLQQEGNSEIKPVLESISSQWASLEDTKDQMLYLATDEILALGTYCYSLTADENWTSSLKNTTTTVIKRAAQLARTRQVEFVALK